jgi:hypothetical protein
MKFMKACLFSIVALVSSGINAMDVAQSIRVEFSNQTEGDLTIFTSSDQLITLRPYEDKTVQLSADFAVVAGKEKMTFVYTNQGDFFIDYNGLNNSLLLTKASATGKQNQVGAWALLAGTQSEVGILRNPRNPIIIFQQGANVPTMRERQ